MPFAAVNAATLDELSSEGTPFSKLTGNALLDVAHDFGVRDPALLADEESLRLLVASLAVASGALDGDPSAVTAPSVKWHSLESETRGLLVLTIRSKGLLPQSTAAALNVLAQPSVVRRYKLRGNRWTEPPAPGFSGLGAASNGSVVDEVAGAAGSVEDEDAPLLDEDTLQILQAAKDGFGDDFATRSTGEWLNALAAAFDTPLPERPWYMSGGALFGVAGMIALLLFHAFILKRTLDRLKLFDSMVFVLPLIAFAGAGLVGAFAVFVHRSV